MSYENDPLYKKFLAEEQANEKPQPQAQSYEQDPLYQQFLAEETKLEKHYTSRISKQWDKIDDYIPDAVENFTLGGVKSLSEYGASASKLLGSKKYQDKFSNVREFAEKKIEKNDGGIGGFIGEMVVDPLNLTPAGIFTKGTKGARIAKSVAGGAVVGAGTMAMKNYGNDTLTQDQKNLEMGIGAGFVAGINGIIAGVTKGRVSNAVDADLFVNKNSDEIADAIMSNPKGFGLSEKEAKEVILEAEIVYPKVPNEFKVEQAGFPQKPQEPNFRQVPQHPPMSQEQAMSVLAKEANRKRIERGEAPIYPEVQPEFKTESVYPQQTQQPYTPDYVSGDFNKNIPTPYSEAGNIEARYQKIASHPRLQELLEMRESVLAKDSVSHSRNTDNGYFAHENNGNGYETTKIAPNTERNYNSDFQLTKQDIYKLYTGKADDDLLSKLETDLGTLDNHPNYAPQSNKTDFDYSQHQDPQYTDKPKEMSDADWATANEVFSKGVDNLAVGTYAGIEEDENGNITFDAEKFVLGLGGYTAVKQALKNEKVQGVLKDYAQQAIERVDFNPEVQKANGFNSMFVGSKGTEKGSFSDVATKKTMREIDDSPATLNKYQQGVDDATNDVIFNAQINGKDIQASKIKEFASQLRGTTNDEAEAIFNKKFDEMALAKDVDREKLFDEIDAIGSVIRRAKNKPYGKLSDYITHDELFKQYPNLKDIHIQWKMDGLDGGALGSYKPKTDGSGEMIQIDALRPSNEIKSTLLHEIQHYIQKEEGWARGGNVQEMSRDIPIEVGEVQSLLQDAIKKKNSDDWVWSSSSIEEILQAKKVDTTISKEAHEWAMNIAKAGEKEIDTFLNNTPHSKYLRLHGEQQARATQARANMTPEQRQGEDWTKTLARAEGEYKEPIVKFKDGVSEMSPVKSKSQKEKRGIYNVAFNGKNSTEVRKADGELVELSRGNLKYGAEHIKFEHMGNNKNGKSKNGVLTDAELLQLGEVIRNGKMEKKPKNKHQYTYFNEAGERFRAIVGKNDEGETVVSYYSNRREGSHNAQPTPTPNETIIPQVSQKPKGLIQRVAEQKKLAGLPEKGRKVFHPDRNKNYYLGDSGTVYFERGNGKWKEMPNEEIRSDIKYISENGANEFKEKNLVNDKALNESFVEQEKIFSNEDNYKMEHTAPTNDGYNASSDNVESFFSKDIYSKEAQRLHGHGNKKMDKESLDIINSVRGKPSDEVTIYRAIPDDIDASINPKDWVTTSREYAKSHGESALNGKYKIVEIKAKAKDLYTDGNSIHEWGYDPISDPNILKANGMHNMAGGFAGGADATINQRDYDGDGEFTAKDLAYGVGAGVAGINTVKKVAPKLFDDGSKGGVKAGLFAGSKAKGFDAKAQAGKTFEGKYDTLERFEIDDSKATLKATAKELNKAKNERLSLDKDAVIEQYESGAIPFEEAKKLADDILSKYNNTNSGTYQLDDVLDHQELFSNYPKSSEIKVTFTDMPKGANGYYDSKANEIVLNTNMSNDEIKSSLLHELQHSIQKREGFARGGSAQEFYNDAKKDIDLLKYELEFEPDDFIRDKMMARLQKLEDKYNSGGKDEAFDMYQKLAGEIEARDVQARADYTPQQREEIAPYSSENIAQEDANVRFNNADDELVKNMSEISTKDKNFKRWFNGSKVVDKHGEPLVVYHGTDKDFSKFDLDKSYDGGLWFTSDVEALNSGNVGAGASGNIKPVYLSSKKMAGWDEYEKFSFAELKRDGYDGVKLDNDYIVFEPTQIKSKFNNGNFDKNNPNIMMSESAPKKPFKQKAKEAKAKGYEHIVKLVDKETKKEWGDATNTLKRLFTDTLGADYHKLREDATASTNGMSVKLERLHNVLNELSDTDRVSMHNYIVGEESSIPDALKPLAENIKKSIDDLSKQLVDLEVLPQEQYDEWAGHYIHRNYEKHFFKDIKGLMSKGFKLDEIHKRGKIEEINATDAKKLLVNPTFIASTKKLMKDGGKRLKQLPSGKYELRRDWTKEEREAMGEITDASISAPETLMRLKRMVDNANFMKNIEDIDNVILKDVDGFSAEEISAQGFAKVPNSPKFGVLAGKTIRKDVLDDLSARNDELFNTFHGSDGALSRIWKNYLSVWKKSKTVWNVPSHVNNFMSNTFLMHLAGMRADEVVTAVGKSGKMMVQGNKYEELLKKQMLGKATKSELSELAEMGEDLKYFIEAKEGGLLGRSQLNDILQGSQKQIRTSKLGKLDKFTEDAYHNGDAINRIAMYSHLRSKLDMSADEARKAVLTIMPDYSKPMPKGFRALRDSGVSPFISWSYYTMPAVVKMLGTKQGAKKATLAMGTLAGLEYALTGGDVKPTDNIPFMDTNKPEDFKGRRFGVSSKNGKVDTVKTDRWIPYVELLNPVNFLVSNVSGVTSNAVVNTLTANSAGGMINPYYGRPITYKNKNTADKAYDYTKYLAKSYVPLPAQAYSGWDLIDSLARSNKKRKTNKVTVPRSTEQNLLKQIGLNSLSYSKSGLKKEQRE